MVRIGCKEILDLHASVCHLRDKWDICQAGGGPLYPDCPDGLCVKDWRVFGIGSSGGGGRLFLGATFFPLDFKRIAMLGGATDLETQYGAMTGHGGIKCVLNKIINPLGLPTELITNTDLFNQRSADHRVKDFFNAQQDQCAGAAPYTTGVMGIHSVRDSLVPVSTLDTTFQWLDNWQTGAGGIDPKNWINTQKIVFCEPKHGLAAGRTVSTNCMLPDVILQGSA